MVESREAYIIAPGVRDVPGMVQRLNFALQRIADRLDKLEGIRYQATIINSPIFTSLTASRIVASNAVKELASADLASWIDGTNCTITDDGDGTITIEMPQSFDTTDTPEFAGLTITGNVLFYYLDANGTAIHAYDVTHQSSDTHGFY